MVNLDSEQNLTWRNPLKYVKSFWLRLNAYEKLHSLKKFVTFFGRILQIELFAKRPNGPVAHSFLHMCILTLSLIAYTTCYYTSMGNFTKAIPTYCMLGIVAATYPAGFSLIFGKRTKWVPLFEMPGQYIYRDNNQSTAYNNICSKCMDQTLKTFIMTVTVIMISFVGALIGPVYAYLQDGSLVTLYEVRVPFLQEHPTTEFIVNIVWQCYVSIIGGIPGLFVIEGMIAIVNNTITVTSMLAVNQLEVLSDELEIGERNQSLYRVKKIFHQIIYMDDYIENFRDAYYWRLFISPPAFLFSISVSIYSQYMMGFPAGYGIAVVSYIQMAVLCVTGQNVIDRNERLLDAVCQLKWYYLPVEHQKHTLFMIIHLQSKDGLTIGPFEQLNFETLKVLTQKVSSFLMFLINLNAE